MCEQLNPLDGSRKRQRIEHHSPQGNRKTVNSQSTEHHSAFWDKLSKIWLTKYALRELGRRNGKRVTQSTSRQVPQSVTRPITQSFRKGRRSAQTAGELLHTYTAEEAKDVQLFARHGGPDLSDLRGYPSFTATMSSSRSSGRSRGQTRGSSRGRSKTTTTKTTTTKTKVAKSSKNSRPKDPNYQQRLIDSCVYPIDYEYPDGNTPALPNEWAQLKQRLARPRPSLSSSTFPEEEHQQFVRKNRRAANEDAVKDSVIPAMLEAIGASNDAQKNIWFTNTDPITAGISQPKPDYYHGAPPEQIHQQVREDLSSHIIPSTQTKLPAVPNFSMEVKGPRGIVQEAELQACNNGAIGARAMHSLQNYGQDEPVYHNRVSTISSTYHFGHLMMYGHSIAQPNGPGTEPHYYMHQLGDFSMTHSTDTFLQGATAFKNSKDLMKEYRNTAIAQANAIAATRTAEDQEDEEDEDGEDEDGEDEDGEDEDGEDEDGEDEDGEDDAGADTMLNFAAGTSDSIPSMLVKNEDEEEDPDDSKTSVERRPPPRKKRKSCETSDMSKGSSKKSCGKKGSGKGKAWFSFGLF